MNDFSLAFNTLVALVTDLRMADIVYALCCLTALACAALLLRGYRRTRARLLLWAGVCFTLLALNNALVFVDMVTMPEIDLSFLRTLPALAGVFALIYGLVWEDYHDV